MRHDANLRPDTAHFKYFIENLKSEKHFKNIFDENYFNNNIINNYQKSNNLKRPISYIKKPTIFNTLDLPELDNSNRKHRNINNNININNNNYRNIYSRKLNIINDHQIFF